MLANFFVLWLLLAVGGGFLLFFGGLLASWIGEEMVCFLLATALLALAGALEPEEMAHLAWVAEQPENLANSRRALADYIALIREEGLRRSGTDEEALLRAAQKRYQETKAYMEEKP